MSTVNDQETALDDQSISQTTKEFRVADFVKVSSSISGSIRFSIGDDRFVAITANENALESIHVGVNDDTLVLRSKQHHFESASRKRSLASHLLDLILKRRTPGIHGSSAVNTSKYSIEITAPRICEVRISHRARMVAQGQLRDSESVKLICSGASKASFEGVDAPHVHLVSSGTASLAVKSVKSESLDCRMSGKSSIQAKGDVETTSAKLSGKGYLDAIELTTNHASLRMSGATNALINAQRELEVASSGACSVRYLESPELNTRYSGVLDCSRMDEVA